MFCQTPVPGKNLCPSYKGKYYKAAIARVKRNVELVKPDYVFFDIEEWYRGASNAEKCKRCSSGQKSSGKSMDEYLKYLGTEKMRDLYEAVKQGSAGYKMPVIGAYNYHAAHPVHHIIMDFNRLYPDYVQLAQPSLYVAGDALTVHNSIRKNYELLGEKHIIPWLTAGCYGEFSPDKMEQMVLEALMNGACGITYYSISNFDTSLDFYYHAKALSMIAPYEDIIVEGDVITSLRGSNKKLTYSAIKKGNEMLLLIGNYKKVENGNTEISLPFKGICAIKNLRNDGETIRSKEIFKTNIPKGQIGLYYIKKIMK